LPFSAAASVGADAPSASRQTMRERCAQRCCCRAFARRDDNDDDACTHARDDGASGRVVQVTSIARDGESWARMSTCDALSCVSALVG
jgi:hypothetical protein